MRFEAPQLEITHFTAEDVITASGFDMNDATTINFGDQKIAFSNNVPSVYDGDCIVNGLTEGVDFVCLQGYSK